MKQFLITLSDAIKNGILRIFPRIRQTRRPENLVKIFSKIFSKILSFFRSDPLRNLAILFLAGFSVLILIGCSTQRQVVTQLVHDIRVDTIYMNSQQYDSIYIYQDRLLDRSKDTIYLKDVSVEYRYKLLRDTIKVIQHDSIPYQVTVIETKEITRPKTTFDIISYWCFGIVVGMILFLIYRLIRKLKIGF